MYKILLVEDDKSIREIIVKYFSKREFEVIEAIDGYDALAKIDSSINLVLLDIMMPDINGLEVCYQIRLKHQCSIVFISALSDEDTQLRAFELGGDDYIAKPFLPSVLYAKCIAICKRQCQNQSHVKRFHDLLIDYTTHQVWVQNKEIYLTYREYLLLEYLTKNTNRLLEREQILNTIWGYDYYGDCRVVDTYIKKVRKKMEPCQYIHTVFKVGYMFKDGGNYEKDIENNIILKNIFNYIFRVIVC